MRIALIGLGDIAQKAYLPLLTSNADITPVLCTRNTGNLVSLSRKYRIEETYTDIKTLISSGLDAAMVHTSTESHPPIVAELLRAGIAVFVDKPLSYHLNDCESVLTLARQKNLPVFLGFNRRYAPLIKSIDTPHPTHIRLQKNRVNQPAEPRVFIFDDFIHVLDTLLFLGGGNPQDVQVAADHQKSLLAGIHVQWQAGKVLLTGSMNRISGVTEEELEFFAQNEKWKISNLACGWHYHDNKKTELGFNDWEQTLYKRGFVDMVNAFVNQIQAGSTPNEQLEDILTTHRLCDEVLTRIATP